MPQNDPSNATDSIVTAEAPSAEVELATERSFCTFESFDYDASEDTYRVLFDPETVDPSTAVVSALAVISDTDPVDLEPLYNVIDPDCLDSIASKQPSAGDVEIAFRLNGYAVEAKSSGSIEFTPS